MGGLSLLRPNNLYIHVLLYYHYHIIFKVCDTRVICAVLLYIQPSTAHTLRYYFVFVLFNIVLLLSIYQLKKIFVIFIFLFYFVVYV